MATNASINIKFIADLAEFSTKMQNAQRSIESAGKQMQQVGKSLTIGVTAPLLALGVAGVRAWDTQAKAIAQVETGLKSTGNAVGYTSQQLQEMASALQNNSLFGDEAILKDVTAQLLTFTNISGTAFERTQQAALDLATRLDGDLKSASIQLGKALNDPVANLSALSRSGIQFSESQKETINSLVKSNQLFEAQTIILDELEKQYGGSAEAASKAGLGPFKQLANSIGDLNEEFGKIIGEALLPFVDKLKSMVQGFQGLSPETKKFIVILGGVAAAIGPLLALAGTILPAIVTGFTVLTGPIGLVVAGLTAVGVIIYKNWQPIKKTLVDIANYFIDLYNESTLFRAGVEAVVLSFKNMWQVGVFVFDALGSVISALGRNIKNSFVGLGELLKAALTFDGDGLQNALLKIAATTYDSFGKLVTDLKGDFNKLSTEVGNNITTALNNVGQRTKISFVESNIDATAITNAVSKAVATGVSGSGTGQAQRPTATALTGTTAGIDQSVSFAEPVKNQLVEVDEAMVSFQLRLQEFNEQSGEILNGLAENFVVGFAEIGAAVLSGNAGLGDVLGFLVNMLADVAIQIGKTAIKIGLAMKAVKLSFSNPLAAIAAGAALVLIGTLMKGLAANYGSSGGSVPALANGGIVSGPTLAYVGEYSGASSNPEVIAPLSKLRNMIAPQGGQLQLVGEVKLRQEGRDLVGVIRAENFRNKALGGNYSTE